MPVECLQQQGNTDDEDDIDYKRPLRAPRNRENVFGPIPGNVIQLLTSSQCYTVILIGHYGIVCHFDSTVQTKAFYKTELQCWPYNAKWLSNLTQSPSHTSKISNRLGQWTKRGGRRRNWRQICWTHDCRHIQRALMCMVFKIYSKYFTLLYFWAYIPRYQNAFRYKYQVFFTVQSIYRSPL